MEILILEFPSRLSTVSSVIVVAVSVENYDYILYQMTI